eukprot:gene272-6687_t
MEAFLNKQKLKLSCKKKDYPLYQLFEYPNTGKFNYQLFLKQYLKQLKEDYVYFSTNQQTNDYISCLDQKEKYLLSGSSSGEIKFINTELENIQNFTTGKQKNEILSIQSKKFLSSVKFGRTETEIISTSRNQSYIYFYDVNSSMTAPVKLLKVSSDVYDIQIYNDILYGGCRDGTIFISDPRKKTPKVSSLISSKGSVNSVLLSHCGNYLHSGTSDNSIITWDIRYQLKKLKTFDVKKSITTLASRLRFDLNCRSQEINKNIENNLNLMEEDEEGLRPIDDFSSNQSRIRNLNQYYLNTQLKELPNRVSSLIADPTTDQFIMFQLQDGSVGQYDIIQEKLKKFYQPKSNHLSCKICDILTYLVERINNDIEKTSPCFLNKFNSLVCVPLPMFKELIFLDFSKSDELIYFDLFNFTTNTNVIKSTHEIVTSRIELKYAPSIVKYEENKNSIFVGCTSNNIIRLK